MEEDKPDEGILKIGETVKMIGVGQDRMEELNADRTVFEEISGGEDDIELGTQKVNSRAYCSWFGFKGGQQQAKIGNLSGGERNRAQLAKLLKSGANMIILGNFVDVVRFALLYFVLFCSVLFCSVLFCSI